MSREAVTSVSSSEHEEQGLEHGFGGDPTQEFGYKRALVAVYLEMVTAIAVTIFSLYMALTGTGGFLRH